MEKPIVPFDEPRRSGRPASSAGAQRHHGEFHEAVSAGLRRQYSVGWINWLDIAPEGVSKAHGLEIVTDALGVAREDTVGAGDGSNDLEMIEWVDHGIVMGQAGEPLKELASVVTGTVEEDGLATALIDHLGLEVLAEA